MRKILHCSLPVNRIFAFIFIVIYVAAAILLPQHKAMAVSQNDYNHLFIPMQDENDCGGGNNTGPSSSGGITSGAVYMLGDSITVGAYDKYKTAYTSKGLEPFINASGGSSWKGAGLTKTPEGSMKKRSEAVDDDVEKIKSAKAIVIALGTNGSLGSNPIDEIITKMRSINSTASIFWVNTVETGTNKIGLGEFNRQLDDKSGSLNYKVVSWAKAFNASADGYTMPIPDTNGLMGDGYVHPNGKGQDVLVPLVVNAVASGGGNTSSVLGATTPSIPIPDNPPVISNDGIENAKIPADKLVPANTVPNVSADAGISIRKELADPLGKLAAGFKTKFGRNLNVFSGYRNAAQQQVSIDGAKAKGHPERAAPIGQSSHGWGLAVDIVKETLWSETGGGNFDSEEYKWLASDGVKLGWKNPYYKGHGGQAAEESWHWEYGTVSTWGAGNGGQATNNSENTTTSTDVCCADSGSTSNESTGAANGSDVEYTDPARNNRKVGATIYLPNDSNPHPLVMFAPGRDVNSKANDSKGIYARYLSAIASKGFVVVGANFTDNNSAGAVPSEVEDMKFLITKMDSEEKVQGKISKDSGVGLIGHSDGGMVATQIGYGPNKDDRLTAVIAADGAIPGSSVGPPLLMLHGAQDTGNTPSMQSQYDSSQAPYTALALINGADHFHYITGAARGDKVTQYDSFHNLVDELSGAFLKRTLNKEISDATSVSKIISSKYATMVQFSEKGNDTITSSGGGSTSSSTNDSSSPVCCPAGGSGSTVSGGDAPAIVWNFLVTELQFSAPQAAGIMGNLDKESGFNPSITNGIGAFGIVQWLGGRLTKLQELAESQNKDKTDLGVQLQFMKIELEGSFKASTLEPIKASNDIGVATRVFLEKYEAPCIAGPGCDSEYSDRKGRADNWLTKFGNGAQSSDSTPSGNGGGCNGASSGSTELPQGTKEELIEKIKNSGKVTGANLLTTDLHKTTLQVLLKLTEKYSFSLWQGAHRNNEAVDLGNINGKGVPTGNDYAAINDDATNFIKDTMTLIPPGNTWIGVSNEHFMNIGNEILKPKGGSVNLDLPNTTKATGAHFHIATPTGAE